MADSYYRWFPGDYQRDTNDLSLIEHGAYRVLLDAYYMQGSIPSDIDRLHRICRAFTEEERTAVATVVKRYFQPDGDRLINHKADRELADRKAFIDMQREKGLKSAKIRAERGKGENEGLTVVPTPVEPGLQPDGNLPSPSPSPSPLPSPEKDIHSRVDTRPPPPYKEIIEHLNRKANTHFKHDTAVTRRCIKARWNEGFRLADFKYVIDAKCSHWLSDPEMSEYVRPQTLFGTKFESYLNSSPITRCQTAANRKGNNNGQNRFHHREIFTGREEAGSLPSDDPEIEAIKQRAARKARERQPIQTEEPYPISEA